MVLSYKPAIKCKEDGSSNAAGSGGAGAAGGGFWLLVLLLDDKASKHSLLKRAQSTIWVCLLIIAFTVGLFMLCSLDSVSHHRYHTPFPTTPSKTWRPVKPPAKSRRFRFDRSLALHGLGTVFRRGTFAMSDLVIAHFREDINDETLRFFFRSLFRSGVLSRADIVVMFPCSSLSSSLVRVINEENDYFLRLMDLHNGTTVRPPLKGISRFDPHLFISPTNNDKKKPPIWGANIIKNFTNSGSNSSTDGNKIMSLGSIVGFDVSELNPENSFSGFIDDVPIELRRWVCYQMLLGRLRHRFKHVSLVDVDKVMIVGDLMAGIRRKTGGGGSSSDGLKLFIEDNLPHKCGRTEHPPKSDGLYKKETVDKEKKLVNSGILLGPMAEIRRLVNAMVTEIVRVAIRRKNRRPFHDSELLTYLADTDHNSGEVIRLESARHYYYHHSDLNSSSSHKSFILYGHDNCLGLGFRNLVGMVHTQICSSPIDSSVYRDCLHAYTQHS